MPVAIAMNLIANTMDDECFFTQRLKWLEHLIFAFPELRLMALAVVILLGRYTGYRLTELTRFKALSGK